MFDLFKRNENKGPLDIKGLRDGLLRFIKEQLQKAEGGEGRNIKAIQLYFVVDGGERHLYEGAVYLGEHDKFKDEVQKIADDFALDLPENWILELTFEAEYPAEAIKSGTLKAAIFIRTKDHALPKSGTAIIQVLNGEAEQAAYELNSTVNRINIGREQKAQVDDGFFRINQIAFPGNSNHESNKFISRQHAHIEWNGAEGCFMLFADEGGVPPGNKTKIKSLGSENPLKLLSTHVGHQLQNGDQVILGESAVLEFSYKS